MNSAEIKLNQKAYRKLSEKIIKIALKEVNERKLNIIFYKEGDIFKEPCIYHKASFEEGIHKAVEIILDTISYQEGDICREAGGRAIEILETLEACND
jgi:hypothetical protein